MINDECSKQEPSARNSRATTLQPRRKSGLNDNRNNTKRLRKKKWTPLTETGADSTRTRSKAVKAPVNKEQDHAKEQPRTSHKPIHTKSPDMEHVTGDNRRPGQNYQCGQTILR